MKRQIIANFHLMSKIKFQLGTTEHIKISLPSHKAGDGSILLGRATLRVGSLVATERILISETHLQEFFSQLKSAYETLRGDFVLQSDHPTFVLRGKMTRKGSAQVHIRMYSSFAEHPDNVDWQAEANILCSPDDLKRVIEA